MAIFEWNTKYSVGNFDLDTHHKKLFAIMNELYDLMAASATEKDIIRIVDELLSYTNYHFSEEEKMMEKIGYPELSSHKQLHKDFISAIEKFQQDANNGKARIVAIRVADVGIDWLKSHILTVDTRYKTYIETR